MLITCPECTMQLSDKAYACPHCGYPMQPEKMTQRRPNKRKRLPNGFGQISRINGRNLRKPYRAMVTVGKTPEGKPICKLLKPEAFFETYNDAYAALVEYHKNPYDIKKDITLVELYENWSPKHYETLKTTGSIRQFELAWSFCSEIYSMKVADIRARHIKGCIEYGTAIVRGKQKNPTVYTKGKIKELFNLMLDYAVEYEIVDRNYSRTFNLSEDVTHGMSTTKKGHIAFTDNEISRLWEHKGKSAIADMLLVQCYSGWRPSEILNLKLDNVNLKEMYIIGGMKTKAGIDRKVPIHSKISDIVAAHYAKSKNINSLYLFTDDDEQYTYPRFTAGFNRLKKKLQLDENHRPHDGRKHFITAAKRAGVDEYAIKYIVGHTILDITEKTYTERKFEWLKTEIEKLS